MPFHTRPPMTSQEIASLIKQFDICWEVRPKYKIVQGSRRQIGFLLELRGTHSPEADHPSVGCHFCVDVYNALRLVAAHIKPPDVRPSSHDIEPFDQSLHYSKKRDGRAEVVFPINILHKKNYDDPVDDCEIRCLTEMKEQLISLGAREG